MGVLRIEIKKGYLISDSSEIKSSKIVVVGFTIGQSFKLETYHNILLGGSWGIEANGAPSLG